jgi:hypothetical protein
MTGIHQVTYPLYYGEEVGQPGTSHFSRGSTPRRAVAALALRGRRQSQDMLGASLLTR